MESGGSVALGTAVVSAAGTISGFVDSSSSESVIFVCSSAPMPWTFRKSSGYTNAPCSSRYVIIRSDSTVPIPGRASNAAASPVFRIESAGSVGTGASVKPSPFDGYHFGAEWTRTGTEAFHKKQPRLVRRDTVYSSRSSFRTPCRHSRTASPSVQLVVRDIVAYLERMDKGARQKKIGAAWEGRFHAALGWLLLSNVVFFRDRGFRLRVCPAVISPAKIRLV